MIEIENDNMFFLHTSMQVVDACVTMTQFLWVRICLTCVTEMGVGGRG